MDDGAFGGNIVGPKEGSVVTELLVPPVRQVEPLLAWHPESVDQERCAKPRVRVSEAELLGYLSLIHI